MSGTLCALAGAAPGANPPLTCSIAFNNISGSGPDVNSTSGDLYDFMSGSGGVVLPEISGGSGTYTVVNVTLVQDSVVGGSGSVTMGDVPGDPTHHKTAFWSGMTVGATVLFHLHIDVTDSNGATASADSPGYLIHRTS